jgi:hypothetical protein
MFFVYRKHISSPPGSCYDGAWLGECVRTLRSLALKNTMIVSAIGGVVEHYHWSIDDLRLLQIVGLHVAGSNSLCECILSGAAF